MLEADNSRTLEFVVSDSDAGQDAGAFLKRKGVSRRLITKLKRVPDGICCDGKHIRVIDIVNPGSVISIRLEDDKKLEPNGNLSVPVFFEDEDVIVFNKPVNMPVHPSIKHQGDTLGNYFSYLYPDLTFRPVNRLDRDTSGLCVVAKNAHSANRLQSSVNKVYYAVVCGIPPYEGRIDAPIARTAESIILREVREDGQRAVTDYTIIKNNEKYSLVKVILQTGRTHQIRVHFAYIGYPLAGDDMYGGDVTDTKVQALHCGEVTFVHPVTGKKIRLTCDIRDDMKRLTDCNVTAL